MVQNVHATIELQSLCLCKRDSALKIQFFRVSYISQCMQRACMCTSAIALCKRCEVAKLRQCGDFFTPRPLLFKVLTHSLHNEPRQWPSGYLCSNV